MTAYPDAMDWLRARVPLTLVIDLLDAAGPDSARIYAQEPGDTDWLHDLPGAEPRAAGSPAA